MLKPDTYVAFAKFSEMPEKKESLNLKDFFSSSSAESDKNRATELINSRHVIEPVVRKFGMQASCYLKNKSRLMSIFKRYFRNLKRELKVSSEESTHFRFKNVSCPGIGGKYLIFFRANDCFEILDMKKKIKAKGEINEKISFDNVSFIIQQSPRDLKKNKAYILSFTSIEACIGKVKRNLKIQQSQNSNNVLDLTKTLILRLLKMS